MYARVSRDDGGAGDSRSISGQRLALAGRVGEMLAQGTSDGDAGARASCVNTASVLYAARSLGGCTPSRAPFDVASGAGRNAADAVEVPAGSSARAASAAGAFAADAQLFVDDGYSGLTMERPSLRRLLDACADGIVSCVVVCDLSRLSRSYIDLGDLIDGFFPLCGVRFVSIAEGVDLPASGSGRAVCDDGLARGLFAIAANSYSVMLSRSVRTSMRARWHAGEHVQAFVPFGYVYDRAARGNLGVDPVASRWVRVMFAMAAAGLEPREVALQLRAAGIPTPADYARLAGGPKAACYGEASAPWDSRKVRHIVRREVYAGVLVGGKTRGVGIGRGAPRRCTALSERVRVEGAHEPIVSRELFDAAQDALGRVGPGRPRTHA